MKHFPKIVVCLVALGFLAWFGHSKISEWSSKRKEAREYEQRKLEKSEKLTAVSRAFAERYNAETNWYNKIQRSRRGSRRFFTVDVEDALKSSSGKPVLIVASVYDVIRQGDKVLVYFRLARPSNLDIHCLLECNPEQMSEIRTNANGIFHDYAVVASISTVKSPTLEVKPEATLTGDEESPIESYIDYQPSDVFVAKGRCVDLAFVGY